MTAEQELPKQQDTAAEGAEAQPAPEAAAEVEAPAEAEALPPPDPLALAQEEIAALRDRLLRAMAEMENLRRRTEREKAEATLYAASNFARDMLGVADNLARALASLDAGQREAADAGLRALIEGVEVTQRELLNVFERHGIARFDPKGEKFDPHFHQAMFELPAIGVAPGTVVETIQPGYRIGERVLRPAMVGVAKAAAPAGDNGGNGSGGAR
jgi:molecular chaperone GrpE